MHQRSRFHCSCGYVAEVAPAELIDDESRIRTVVCSDCRELVEVTSPVEALTGVPAAPVERCPRCGSRHHRPWQQRACPRCLRTMSRSRDAVS